LDYACRYLGTYHLAHTLAAACDEHDAALDFEERVDIHDEVGRWEVAMEAV
jgi:hypothetical protein